MVLDISAREKFSVKLGLDRYITEENKASESAQALRNELRQNGDVLMSLKEECLHPHFAKDTTQLTITAFKNRACQRLKMITELEKEGLIHQGFVAGKHIQLVSRNAVMGKTKSLNQEVLRLRARLAAMHV